MRSFDRLDPDPLHQLGGGEHVLAKVFPEFIDAHRHRLAADLGEPLLHDRELLTDSAWMRSTISSGVFAGTKIPVQNR